MAFYDPNKDEDQQQDPNAGTGIQTGPQSAAVYSGTGAPGAATQKQSTPDKSGNFVGISQYLNANKPQAEKLGDQAAGVINQSADQARSGVQALNTEASQKITGTSALGDDLKNKIQTGAEGLSQAERDQIKNTQSAQYKGPQSATQLENYGQAQKASQTAQQNIDNSGTEEGRMNLISQINAKPRTQGMNVFDNTLLQAGGGREKLAAASEANKDIKGGLDSATQAIQSQIGRADDPSTPDIDESAGAIGQTNKAASDARSTVQSALDAWVSGFNPKVQKAQQDAIAQQNRITQDLGDNQFGLDQETMDFFGLNPDTTLYGLKLNDYIRDFNPGDINASNVATAEDYARYGALADLAGDQSMVLDQKNAELAGTAPTFGADFKGLQQALRDAGVNYDNSYNTLQSGLLDRTFLANPNSALGYGSYDGAQGLEGMKLANATPKEIETKWLPALEAFAARTGLASDKSFVDSVKKSLAQWKKNQGVNNKVSLNSGQSNPKGWTPGADDIPDLIKGGK